MANKKRLVDADILREFIITDYYGHFTDRHDTDQTALINMVCDDIAEASTVGATQIVECKNCQYGHCYNEYYNLYECTYYLGGIPKEADDYCSYGERRE